MGLKRSVKRRDRRKAKASNYTRQPMGGSKSKVGHSIGSPHISMRLRKRDLYARQRKVDRLGAAETNSPPGENKIEPLKIPLSEYMQLKR